MTSHLNGPEYVLLRKILQQERIHERMTQEDVARELGRAQSFVSKYEQGERRLDVVDFIRVCEVLSMPPWVVMRNLCKELEERGEYWETPAIGLSKHVVRKT